MEVAEQAIADAGAQTTVDEATKQNYAQWEADGATYKIWLEDETALEEKLKLMKEYKLAGTAAWRLGFEKSSVWELILKYVNWSIKKSWMFSSSFAYILSMKYMENDSWKER